MKHREEIQADLEKVRETHECHMQNMNEQHINSLSEFEKDITFESLHSIDIDAQFYLAPEFCTRLLSDRIHAKVPAPRNCTNITAESSPFQYQ